MPRVKNNLKFDLINSKTMKCLPERTRKQYKKNLIKFADFCKTELAINRLDKLQTFGYREAIQEYADWLKRNNKTAATIHTYVAAPCKVLNIKMQLINKPIRHSTSIMRSRYHSLDHNIQGEKEMQQERFSRLVNFQKLVGLRRAELKRLTKKDLQVDETGHLCVYVRRGKGGKTQLQRINITSPTNEEFIKNYFDGTDNKVFSAKEMNNKIDLHQLRASNAREMYFYYLEKIQESEEFANDLAKDLIARWNLYHPDPKNPKLITKFLEEMSRVYIIKGGNREIAEATNMPTQYSGLALMAVSVFHLSHWRNNVTVNNYILYAK